jgi:hypothetical protein
MKKKILLSLVVALGVTLVSGVAFAHFWGYGGYGGRMMGPGYGGHMMGPGYWGHMGPGYGGTMMGPGYGDYCGGGGPATSEQNPLTEKDTEAIVKDYIGRNPNLKVGEIKDKGTYFEGEIVTKDNSLVTKLSIDKTTGWVQPLF